MPRFALLLCPILESSLGERICHKYLYACCIMRGLGKNWTKLVIIIIKYFWGWKGGGDLAVGSKTCISEIHDVIFTI